MPEYGMIICWKGTKKYFTELDESILNDIKKFGHFQTFFKIYEQNYQQGQEVYLVNRDKNLVIISYPPGAGGNFLINCIYISNDIKNKRYSTQEEKCNFLCSSYDKQTLYWQDITFQDLSFIGMQQQCQFEMSHPFWANAKQLFKFWKNGNKILIFKNSNLFCSLRNCCGRPGINFNINSEFNEQKYYIFSELGVSGYSHNISNKNPINSREKKMFKLSRTLENKNINLSNYKNLPLNTKIEIQNLFNDKKSTLPQNYSCCKLKDKKQYYFWDCNWFLDEDEFLFNLSKIYDVFDLSGFNEELISKCYNSWMDSMCRSLEIRKECDTKLNNYKKY